MMYFEKIDFNQVPWDELEGYPDRTLAQTLPWLNFIKATQAAEPVVAVIKAKGIVQGYFTGLIVKKYGFRILGSPFQGWTTLYMGFNLLPGTDRHRVLQSLSSFVFNELGCHYLEIADRNISEKDVSGLSFDRDIFYSFEIDLTREEDELYKALSKSCRWSIKKAIKCNIEIEEANDLSFAEDYYAQLQDVFAKQSLVPKYDLNRVQELIRQVHSSGNLLLLRARNEEGVCIATGLFPAFNDTAYFWGGASWRKYQKLQPNELIMWHAMRYWKARGIKKFDMGGGGDYKRKYGVYLIQVLRLKKAKYACLIVLRDLAYKVWRIQLNYWGWLKNYRKLKSTQDLADKTSVSKKL